MIVKKLNTIITNFKSPVIQSLRYDLKILEIEYSPCEGEVFWIQFDNPIGFKCLDERDMNDYWKHKELTDNWILEIKEGGWLDFEKSRAFISHNVFELKEFLIKGVDDCISVLCACEPRVEITPVSKN